MRRERDIKEQIETDERILLVYGVPLPTIPYKKIWEKSDQDMSTEITNEGADVAETEKEAGRPGAFVIRRLDTQTGIDNVEVWGWVI